MKRMKGKSDNTLLWIALGVIVLAGFGIISIPGFLSSVGGGASYTATSPGACTGGNSQSLLMKGQDVKTNAALTETHNLIAKVNSDGTLGAWGTFTQGTAVTTLTPGNKYIVVPGIDTSSFTGNAFGAPYMINSLDCRVDSSIPLTQDATTFTGTFINNNDVVGTYASLSATAATESVGVKMLAGDKTVFGNPYLASSSLLSNLGAHSREYPGCACVQANSTWFDTSVVRSYLSNGVDMAQIGVPTILAAATGDTQVCFESPVVTDIPMRQYFQFKTKTVAGGPLDDGAIKFYPGNDYMNSNTGALEWGCETNAGAAVGAAVVSVTMDVTA